MGGWLRRHLEQAGISVRVASGGLAIAALFALVPVAATSFSDSVAVTGQVVIGVFTSTPVGTATNTPVPSATNTAVPATATNTAVQATATNTAVPSLTATQIPVGPQATATPTVTATSTPIVPKPATYTMFVPVGADAASTIAR